jgi:membrane protein
MHGLMLKLAFPVVFKGKNESKINNCQGGNQILRLIERGMSWLDIAKETRKKFAEDNGILIAGAVSFFAFLSIFPLLLTATGILGVMLGSPEEAEKLVLSATKLYTVGGQARELITQVIKGKNIAVGIGMVLLLWSGTTVMVMLEQAMNLAWGVREKRSFLRSRAVGFALFAATSILVLIAIGLTTVANYITNRGAQVIPGWSELMTFNSYLVPFLAISANFTLIYKILPFTYVEWKVAVIGGVFAGILWEIALQIFAFYVVNFARYNQVYGSLGAVILLLIWINYSAIIIILGAELTSIIQYRREATG